MLLEIKLPRPAPALCAKARAKTYTHNNTSWDSPPMLEVATPVAEHQHPASKGPHTRVRFQLAAVVARDQIPVSADYCVLDAQPQLSKRFSRSGSKPRDAMPATHSWSVNFVTVVDQYLMHKGRGPVTTFDVVPFERGMKSGPHGLAWQPGKFNTTCC
jgi:hypothetical protein